MGAEVICSPIFCQPRPLFADVHKADLLNKESEFRSQETSLKLENSRLTKNLEESKAEILSMSDRIKALLLAAPTQEDTSIMNSLKFELAQVRGEYETALASNRGLVI